MAGRPEPFPTSGKNHWPGTRRACATGCRQWNCRRANRKPGDQPMGRTSNPRRKSQALRVSHSAAPANFCATVVARAASKQAGIEEPVVYSAMARREWWSRLGSRLFVLAVLAAFIAVQDPMASLHEHSHSGPHQHCCAACHSGLFLAVPASAPTLPFDEAARWFTRHAAQPQPGSPVVIASSSRGPPAASSLHLA